MNKPTKKQIASLVLLLALIISITLSSLLFTSFCDKEKGTYLHIDSDDTADSIYHKLSLITQSPNFGLRLCGALMHYRSHIHPGQYKVGNRISSFTLMRRLRGGQQTPVQLVIPVTHTLGQLAKRLSQRLEADSTQLMQVFTDSMHLLPYGVTPTTAPCLFIPNTYEVYWDIKPIELLKKMAIEHDKYWTPKRRQQAQSAGLTSNQLYILASIVEQESCNESERPRIAGMYINRLQTGMKLQADPTVKYALHDFALRRILHTHLMVDSPYNTYLHAGLPIGPICIPSLNSIESTLNYQHHPYLYMCAKEDFSGTHNFATTYAEHLINAKKYTDALNQRNIKP